MTKRLCGDDGNKSENANEWRTVEGTQHNQAFQTSKRDYRNFKLTVFGTLCY
jgi:hypothetical protein